MQTPSPLDAPPLLKQTPLDADPITLDATSPPRGRLPWMQTPPLDANPLEADPPPRGRPPSMTDRNV